MTIHLIAAVTKKRVIGNRQGLPWHIPEDLRRFKKLTTGKTVLMGRTTFDTIGRPLPHRQNIVLDKDKKLITGAHVCDSLPEALTLAKELGDELYVMGGASVYAQMLPFTQIMHLSHIKKNYEGDIYFPAYGKKEWQEVAREEYEEFTAVTYVRK